MLLSDAEATTSPEDDPSVSSASLLLSPRSEVDGTRRGHETPLESPTEPPPAPLGTSTPMHPVPLNGVTKLDKNSNCEDVCVIDNDNGNLVAESTNSIDVLSAGESDAGDTLRCRKHHNSISSSITQMGHEGSAERTRRVPHNELYLLCKELLMSERTYKRDLELITVCWSVRVSALAGSTEGAGEVVSALGRGCLALEPLALAQGALLARLDAILAKATRDNEEEYKKVADLFYDYIASTYDAYVTYINRAGILLARLESARRSSSLAATTCLQHEAAAPMTLAASLLRPLHNVARYRNTYVELSSAMGEESAEEWTMLSHLNEMALQHLSHAENHAHLCQLQRDITGYDKLLVADREFLRLGCLYKHSNKGLQHRMLFLFSDIVIISSKPSTGTQFKAVQVLPLHAIDLEPCDMLHSFTLQGSDQLVTLSASSEAEYICWLYTLELAIRHAKDQPVEVDTELTGNGSGNGLASSPTNASSSGVGQSLTQVCWHRVTSLSRENLHVALKTQISGYLLRKFKKTLGWQKLWVVFANFTLFFYKSWQDDAALVSLPLLGYSVGPPNESDGINKEYVFKLHFKNHVYFFRADSQFTYERWTETLQTAMNAHQSMS